jgi:hypothetical protein
MKKGFVDFDSSAGAFAHRDGDLQNVSACISRNKYARDAGLTAIGNGKAAFGVALASELLTEVRPRLTAGAEKQCLAVSEGAVLKTDTLKHAFLPVKRCDTGFFKGDAVAG